MILIAQYLTGSFGKLIKQIMNAKRETECYIFITRNTNLKMYIPVRKDKEFFEKQVMLNATLLDRLV
jgi:hypothetical protein